MGMVDTSSFFWLGLVGAVFVGLVLAVTRARLAGRQYAPVRRALPQPKPQLWDVYVPIQEWGTKNVGGLESDEWKAMLPLSLCSFVDDVPPSPRPAPPPQRKRFLFFRKPQQDIEKQPLPTPKIDAQVTTVVLMPTPRKTLSKAASGSRDSSATIPDELQQDFAIGIAWVHGPTRNNLGTIDTTS